MQIRVYAILRDLLGTRDIDLPLLGETPVRVVLDRLVSDYPELAAKLWNAEGELTGFITVLLNGRSVAYLQGLDTPVRDEDTLSLFPPVGGG